MNKDIFLSNTLGGKKEKFVPINNNKIGMYVCGPTVYDFPHIGNARPLVVFDVLFRLLRSLYGKNKVTYVRNITDIDDKTINKANLESIPLKDFTDKYIKAFHEDISKLNILPAHQYPRATEFIDGMINMIQNLEKKGYTYTTDDGSVFFKISINCKPISE